jgi:hypothetical protein
MTGRVLVALGVALLGLAAAIGAWLVIAGLIASTL